MHLRGFRHLCNLPVVGKQQRKIRSNNIGSSIDAIVTTRKIGVQNIIEAVARRRDPPILRYVINCCIASLTLSICFCSIGGREVCKVEKALSGGRDDHGAHTA